MNGGYTIEINIAANSKNIIVNTNTSATEGNAITVITQPFNIVKHLLLIYQ